MGDNRDPQLKLLAWHHGFIGLALAAVGLAVILVVPTANISLLVLGTVLCAVGLWLFVDDVYQHVRQHYEPGYRSPINRLWGRFWRGFCD